jgi:hypothetical protein
VKSRYFLIRTAAAVLLGAAGWLWFGPGGSPDIPIANPKATGKTTTQGNPTTGAQTGSLSPDTRLVQTTPDGRTILPEVAEIARRLNNPKSTAIQDIETLQQLLETYRRANNGKNPSGLNHEIVNELRGANPKNYAVLPADLTNINSKGELTDRWGTPYFFHCLNEETIEIKSAGPDRKFDSKDDVGQITQL